ncbi:MAG: serine/threonine-protein kinase [Blastocatellia bacterium]
MTPERWQKINPTFEEALDLPETTRAEFLDRACAGDADLRRRVLAMLAADARENQLLDRPVHEIAQPLLSDFSSMHSSGPLSGPLTGPLTSQRMIGSYRLLREIGRGGMGKIYLAQDERLGRQVALKLLPRRLTGDADRIARFQREARAASALSHPNILTIYDFGEESGEHYIAAEYIEGQTLREMIGRPNPDFIRALDMVIQIAAALRAAHRAGVIHRDIKPENVMVRPDGYIKVLDFGLAKLTDPETTADQSPQDSRPDAFETLVGFETRPGMVLGTASYMSPEQVRGQKLDARTDLFSLGVVLYELVTGHRPFDGASRIHTLMAITDHDPPPLANHLPHAPTALQQVVSHALARDLAQRYASAEEMIQDLRQCRQTLKTGTSGPTHAPAPGLHFTTAAWEPGRASGETPAQPTADPLTRNTGQITPARPWWKRFLP